MNMQNRFQEVARLCQDHPEVFAVPPEQNDASRLNFLATIIVPSLNAIDGGQWGLLQKVDQGNRIPVDIAMWKDTGEFADVMTGTGATWIPYPPAPPAWVWVPSSTVGTSPSPIPPSGGATSYDEGQVNAFIADAVEAYSEAGATPGAGSAVWVARMVWDARDIGWEAARSKQLAALRSSLGLN